jgi:hypothetical protein
MASAVSSTSPLTLQISFGSSIGSLDDTTEYETRFQKLPLFGLETEYESSMRSAMLKDDSFADYVKQECALLFLFLVKHLKKEKLLSFCEAAKQRLMIDVGMAQRVEVALKDALIEPRQVMIDEENVEGIAIVVEMVCSFICAEARDLGIPFEQPYYNAHKISDLLQAIEVDFFQDKRSIFIMTKQVMQEEEEELKPYEQWNKSDFFNAAITLCVTKGSWILFNALQSLGEWPHFLNEYPRALEKAVAHKKRALVMVLTDPRWTAQLEEDHLHELLSQLLPLAAEREDFFALQRLLQVKGGVFTVACVHATLITAVKHNDYAIVSTLYETFTISLLTIVQALCEAIRHGGTFLVLLLIRTADLEGLHLIEPLEEALRKGNHDILDGLLSCKAALDIPEQVLKRARQKARAQGQPLLARRIRMTLEEKRARELPSQSSGLLSISSAGSLRGSGGYALQRGDRQSYSSLDILGLKLSRV